MGRVVETLVVTRELQKLSNEKSGALRARGFSLIDLLVAMCVIAMLIGILLPALGTVHETARRTVCTSNLRQQGFGVASYADERKGMIPSSFFRPDRGQASSRDMMMTRIGLDKLAGRRVSTQWDGLGLLHEGGFLLGPRVYYCPSHRGEHPFSLYAARWDIADTTDIFSNYQYRGAPDGQRQLFRIQPARTALVSDGLRSFFDYNHEVGCNVLRADLSTVWFQDRGGNVAALIKDSTAGSSPVEEAWRRIDHAEDANR